MFYVIHSLQLICERPENFNPTTTPPQIEKICFQACRIFNRGRMSNRRLSHFLSICFFLTKDFYPVFARVCQSNFFCTYFNTVRDAIIFIVFTASVPRAMFAPAKSTMKHILTRSCFQRHRQETS